MLASRLGMGVLALVYITGCPAEELAPLEPCTQSVGRATISQVGTDEVDLLFVVDDSQSMQEEQSTLAAQLPRLVRVLTSGKLEPDQEQSFRPAKLHVGVVSTDMGGIDSQSCGGLGKDGLLQPVGASSGVTSGERRFLSFDGALPDDLEAQVQAAVALGKEGCGIEQQLDATLKALVPRDGDVDFAEGQGHGDAANTGFLRDDSLVVVILVTDEDDCSAPDLSFLLDAEPADIGVACALDGAPLYPATRYVEGLRALRADRADHVLFAAITGVPPDLVADPDAIDYDAILADPRMEIRSDEDPVQAALLPACKKEGVGEAKPARRIVEVARQFEENGLVQSICNDDYRGALSAVLTRIATILGYACPPRALTPDARGLVDCEVIETMKPGTPCRGQGRAAVDPERDPSLCKVAQVPVVNGEPAQGQAGWWYDGDDTGACGSAGQVRFTMGHEPAVGSRVDLECLAKVTDQEVACETDADCREPQVCDVAAEPPRCVNPTCDPT
jgi:hypothetical protein